MSFILKQVNILNDEMIQYLCKQFQIKGEYRSFKILTNGHINTTYKVFYFRDGEIKTYIIQKINKYVFKEPEEVMGNISHITEYIRKKIKQVKATAKRDVLHYSTTKDGKYFFKDKEGDYWRCSRFVDGSLVVDVTDNTMLIEEAGKAFGAFQGYLSDYPVEKLAIVIPHFHNTVMRFENLKNAYKNNLSNRADVVEKEYNDYLKLEEIATKMYKMQKAGELPLRVTHNDTKCNNVLFDDKTYEHLAVIDLDTVMPGLIGFDFGDSIRYIANSSCEDEKDLSKVYLDLRKFDAYARGFLAMVKDSATNNELETMSLGAITMTVECGIRFLTDYLDGDKYFKVNYADHNLVRSRCQLKLANDMIDKIDKMNEIIKFYC